MGMLLVITAASSPSARNHLAPGFTPASRNKVARGTPVQALVGWPGALVGSGGAARAGAWASPARRSVCAPSAPAAPASRARREIGASLIVHVPFRAPSLAPLTGSENPLTSPDVD